MQRTIAKPVRVSGHGLLTGAKVNMDITPAQAGEGIVFERTDIEPPVVIPATMKYAADKERRTTLELGDVTIDTIEHLMSALAGVGIDNATIKLDGPEVPCGDGSSLLFVEPIE